MDIVILLFFGLLFAWLGAEMAKSRNRNPVTWGILSFLFGVLSIIVLALIGKAADPAPQAAQKG